jgi:adenylate cyclase class 2
MQVEYEATFTNINKETVRQQLKTAEATLVRPEFLQKRAVFNLPTGHEIPGAWARVRDEGDKITVSLKIVDGDRIENQKELQIVVSDFNEAASLLEHLGCNRKAYQETRRELWRYQDTEITIDEWPFLEPFIEIEGPSETQVKAVAEHLGYDWSQAKFCAIGTLYADKYQIDEDVLNNQTPKLTFDMENPFEN